MEREKQSRYYLISCYEKEGNDGDPEDWPDGFIEVLPV